MGAARQAGPLTGRASLMMIAWLIVALGCSAIECGAARFGYDATMQGLLTAAQMEQDWGR